MNSSFRKCFTSLRKKSLKVWKWERATLVKSIFGLSLVMEKFITGAGYLRATWRRSSKLLKEMKKAVSKESAALHRHANATF